MAGAQIAGKSGRDRRQDLCPSRSAQIPCDERDQDHDEGHLDGGQQPDGRRRNPEDGHGRGGKQRSKGRLVDVAEGRVLACHDEIHLVAVEAVRARYRHQPHKHEAGDHEHRPGNGREWETVAGCVGGRGGQGGHSGVTVER
jgi:hypothetical protein